MSSSNTGIARTEKPKFSAMISTPSYQKMINNALRDPERVKRFCAAITSAVAVNPALQDCTPATILSGALLGESLNLSPSPQLGHYYLVPFWDKKSGANSAVFVLGYKGYIQLALRSGYYKRMNVISVKEGELISFNPLTEDIVLDLIQDDEEREKANTIGYVATFEYLNGFTKTIFWSRSKMESHALRYSKGYAAKKGYTFWEKDFDSMAYKTMLRQLISKWGVMSIDLQTAFSADFTPEQDDDFVTTQEMPEVAATDSSISFGSGDNVPAPNPDETDFSTVNLNDL